MHLIQRSILKLRERRAQVLLPSVLLVPLFILVVYLLFDLTNLSMSKVQHQFALDNAAYTQVTSVSSYLNAMAMINGPALYRVMISYRDDKVGVDDSGKSSHAPEVSVFDLFYRAGLFTSMGPDHEKGINTASPKPESTNWDFAYFPPRGDEKLDRYPMDNQQSEWRVYDGHRDWVTPHPKKPQEAVPIMDWDSIYYYKWNQSKLINYMGEVLKWLFFQGNIYESQNYMYHQTTKNAYMFREGYAVNTGDCKPSECAKESARVLAQQLKINTVPFELSDIILYFTDFKDGYHSHWYVYPTQASSLVSGKNLFLFNHFDGASMGRLRNFERGVTLKQAFKTPSNHFRKNLDKKYKPFTRVTVVMSCPRKGNNCVWPNPLPKYNVVLRP